jgi:hypothetical protein
MILVDILRLAMGFRTEGAWQASPGQASAASAALGGVATRKLGTLKACGLGP